MKELMQFKGKINRGDHIGEWMEGGHIYIGKSYIIIGQHGGYEVDPSTISHGIQITNEENQITIWENDIYTWKNAAYGKCTGVIRFGEYMQDGSGGEYTATPCFGFYFEVMKIEPFYEGIEADYPEYARVASVLDIFRNPFYSEVTWVGNSVDNPDVLH